MDPYLSIDMKNCKDRHFRLLQIKSQEAAWLCYVVPSNVNWRAKYLLWKSKCAQVRVRMSGKDSFKCLSWAFSAWHSCDAKARQDIGLLNGRADHKSKACFLLYEWWENLPSATGWMDMRPLGKWAIGDQHRIASVISQLWKGWRSLANSYLKRDLFNPTEGSQNGEGD